MGGIEGRNARMGDQACAILEPNIAAVENWLLAATNWAWMSSLTASMTQEARQARDVRRRQDAEHVVEESLTHPR